jgi:two-component system cell cycle response regulator
MTTKRVVRVLIVEDSPTDEFITRRALEGYKDIDFEIEVLPSTKGLSALLERIDIDLLIIDYSLPGQSGLEFLRELPPGRERPPIIMLTGSGDEIVAKEAILAGAYDYFLKSRIEPEALGEAISDCLEAAAREKAARRQKLETERLAVIDALTDLYNRRYLADALRRECGRAGRYGHTLSCLMIDIDGFKECNDVYGHLHGDAILRQVGSLIAASVRDCDIAARYGGDEFCVVLTETDHEGAVRLAERLLGSIAEQCLRASGSAVTASIGVFTTNNRPALHPEKLIASADAALRQAKAAGKNQVHTTLNASPVTS